MVINKYWLTGIYIHSCQKVRSFLISVFCIGRNPKQRTGTLVYFVFVTDFGNFFGQW
jgi:hypothetical protein